MIWVSDMFELAICCPGPLQVLLTPTGLSSFEGFVRSLDIGRASEKTDGGRRRYKLVTIADLFTFVCWLASFFCGVLTCPPSPLRMRAPAFKGENFAEGTVTHTHNTHGEGRNTQVDKES